MAGDRKKDGSDLLVALLSQVDPEALRKIDLDNMALGSFLKEYTSPPAQADLAVRSSIREDSVIAEISRLLIDADSEQISVLDACCGLATLPRRILQSLTEGIDRISYMAVDEDPNSIRLIKSLQDEFQRFKNFTPFQRQISDLKDLPKGTIDLVVINNALHEIPPRLYPDIFATFNDLLHHVRGSICIVDMESLPEDAPESIAINWSGEEIEAILKAGCFAPVVTRHPKNIIVYKAQVKHATVVDTVAMRNQIITLLRKKLAGAIEAREKVAAVMSADTSQLQHWLVLTGTIARFAEELHAFKYSE